MNYNGKENKHIEYISNKGNQIIGKVWSIGEDLLPTDFEKRMFLFNALVMPVISFGAEIWGLQEKRSIETILSKYVKWTLGVNSNTPDYIWREETKVKKVWLETIKRAWNFRMKALKEIGSEWKRLIVEEQEERPSEFEDGSWGKTLRRIGLDAKDLKQKEIQLGLRTYKEILQRIHDIELQNTDKKISESSFNHLYQEIRTTDRSKYLDSKFLRKDQKLIALFRTGCAWNGKKKWKKEEEKKCRICGEEEETLEHLIEDMQRHEGEKWKLITTRELLSENGIAVKKLRRIENCIQAKKYYSEKNL